MGGGPSDSRPCFVVCNLTQLTLANEPLQGLCSVSLQQIDHSRCWTNQKRGGKANKGARGRPLQFIAKSKRASEIV